MANDTQQTAQVQKPDGGFKKMLNLLSIPIGLLGGFLASKTFVDKSVESNFSSWKLFDPARADRQTRVAVMEAESAKNKWTPAQNQEALNEIRDVYRTGKHAVLEKYNAGTFLNKLKNGNLKNSQKWEALIIGATVTGIAIGATYAITQDSPLASLLSDKKDREISA